MRARLLFVVVLMCVVLASLATMPARADLKKGVAAYRAGDFATARAEFIKLADAGDRHGQFNLGVLYLTGNGVDRDPLIAAAWHRKAADQGLAAAQHGLGVLYYKGLGVTQSYRDALTWFRRAAAQKFAHSEFNIAVMYFNEQGLVRNDLEIVKWLSLAAAREFAAAQFRLAEMYEKAIIFSQNHHTALYWYRLAAENGSGPEASDGIARMEKSLRLRPSGVTPAEPALKAPDPAVLAVSETPGAAAPQRSSAAPTSGQDAGPARMPEADPARGREWRIQFASFRTEAEAEQAWNSLTRNAKGALNGLAPIIERADLGTRGIYHRLQTGPMDNRRAAEVLCARVREARPGQACLTIRARRAGS